tara:strand:- start:29 stop:298 length:270 start_codon:yes stop_codon:yes gene_type:complete
MTDPNLQKIVDSNIEEIEKGNIGKTITHVSGYLDYIYGYHNRDKRKIELTQFIDQLKLLSDSLKLKKLSNGERNVQGQHQEKKRKYRRK